jgi:hypothetical protein
LVDVLSQTVNTRLLVRLSLLPDLFDEGLTAWGTADSEGILG